MLGWMICKFRGAHKWRRKKGASLKACVRCGAVANVKQRKVLTPWARGE